MKAIRFIRELQHRTVRHDLQAESARLAFFAFLGLFPAVLILFALTGFLGRETAFEWIMGQAEATLPGAAADYLAQFVLEVTGTFRPGALSIGLLFLVWSASNIFAVMAHALNVIFGLREDRRWWRRRGLALVFPVVGTLAMVLSAMAVLAGPRLLEPLGIGTWWLGLRWLVVATLVVCAIWLLYDFLPNWQQDRSRWWLLLGALVAAVLWAGTTEAFRLYVTNFGRFSRVYGFVGAVIILQLWLYLSALTLLVGAEVGALARAWVGEAREEG